MIESILKNLAGETAKDLTGKAGIPENLLGELFKVTGNVATQEVAKQATSGGMENLMNLFSNKPNNNFANSIQNNLVSSLVTNFTSKLGLSQQQATMASGIIVPLLINMITKKNGETPENDPSPIQQVFNLGGNAKGAKSMLGGLLGKFLKG